ncbi:hypothetical protein J6590_070730 [Homalodisca vitripennis]|nr:hypothetical protein J6590_070730 [Homalodisca vitripennis]
MAAFKTETETSEVFFKAVALVGEFTDQLSLKEFRMSRSHWVRGLFHAFVSFEGGGGSSCLPVVFVKPKNSRDINGMKNKSTIDDVINLIDCRWWLGEARTSVQQGLSKDLTLCIISVYTDSERPVCKVKMPYCVTQGSILGLYIINLKRLNLTVKNEEVVQYADNMTLGNRSKTKQDLKIKAFIELNEYIEHFSKINLKPTVAKLTQSNLVSVNKKTNTDQMWWKMILDEAESTMFVGMYMDRGLTWSDHINRVYSKPCKISFGELQLLTLPRLYILDVTLLPIQIQRTISELNSIERVCSNNYRLKLVAVDFERLPSQAGVRFLNELPEGFIQSDSSSQFTALLNHLLVSNAFYYVEEFMADGRFENRNRDARKVCDSVLETAGFMTSMLIYPPKCDAKMTSQTSGV